MSKRTSFRPKKNTGCIVGDSINPSNHYFSLSCIVNISRIIQNTKYKTSRAKRDLLCGQVDLRDRKTKWQFYCRAECRLKCAVYSVQCAVCSVQCAVCSVKCVVCSVQYAVCSCPDVGQICSTVPGLTLLDWWSNFRFLRNIISE